MQQWRAVNVLICFYSRYGNTARLAEAVADGARTFPQDQAWVRRVPDLEPEDVIRQDERWWKTRDDLRQKYPEPQPGELRRADALILGSPGYFGDMAAALKYWLETEVRQWKGEEIEEKAGGAFATTSTVHGGNEVTVLTMLTSLMHLGFVICPAGYLYPPLQRNQMPYGATAVTGPNAEIPPTDADLAAANALGYRISHVARWLLAGRAQEELRRRQLGWPPSPISRR
jgi:NAD(P)H dehydrogenase (quinone)